jgi:hypothetical protein
MAQPRLRAVSITHDLETTPDFEARHQKAKTHL